MAELLTRRAAGPVGPPSADRQASTVEAQILTRTEVQRRGARPDGTYGPWREVLDPAGADLSRAPGAPVLLDHMPYTDAQVGVVESVARSGAGVTAVLRFSASEQAQRIFDDIAAAIRRQISVGYNVQRWRRDGGDAENPVFVAEAFTVLEVSVVTIAADAGAGFRSLNPRETSMDTHSPPAVPADALAAITAERSRTGAILDLTRDHKLGDTFAQRHITAGTAIDAVRAAALSHLVERQAETPTSPINPSISGGYDATEPTGQRDAMAEGIVARRRPDLVTLKRGSRAEHYARQTDDDLVREVTGNRSATLRTVMLGGYLSRAHTTSDFPLLLENIGNKSLLAAYELAAPTYRMIAAQRAFADFRPHSFLRPGDFPAPLLNGESAEITYGTLSETKETATAVRLARRLALSREVIVNDGLGALADMSAPAGRRCVDVENATVYALLAQNSGSGPALRDGNAMCTTVRTNKATSGTAIDAAAIGAGRAAMRKLTSLDGLKLNVSAAMLACGPDKEHQALQVVTASTVPATDATSNPYKGKLDVVADANISGNNWYLFANPIQFPTLIWGYLDGYVGPQFQTQEAWATDGVEFRVILYFGAGAIDWRGVYHNAGA